MFKEDELNEYSERVYRYLKLNKSFDLANIESHPCDSGKSYLSVEILCPNARAEDNLFFNTDDERLTVGFHAYHCHFDSFANLDFNEELNSAISLVESLIREELVVVSYYANEEFHGSCLAESDKLEPKHLQGKKWMIAKPSKIEVLSWLGTYDNDILIKGKGGRILSFIRRIARALN